MHPHQVDRSAVAAEADLRRGDGEDAETAPKLLRLIDMLEDCDDVQEVYHNGEISDEVAATL